MSKTTKTDTTTKPNPEPGDRTLKLVCVGPCHTTSHKAGLVFHELNDAGELGAELVFAKRTFPRARAGLMCTVRVEHSYTDEALQVYPSTTEWLGTYDDSDKVLEWTAKARAFQNADAARRAFTKDATRDRLAEAIEPLRHIYATLPPAQQRGLETAVLIALRKKTERSGGGSVCPRCHGHGRIGARRD